MKILPILVCSAMPLPALSTGTYACTELDRVSLSAEGSMRPVYEGRGLTFTWLDQGITADGVFFHDAYTFTEVSTEGFRAYAEDADRSDLYRFEDGILMHTAIVKYGREPSIQSQVFSCVPAPAS